MKNAAISGVSGLTQAELKNQGFSLAGESKTGL